MKELFDLFFCFFRIGTVLFGGGYSMLPFLQRELIEKRGWVTEEEVLDYFAISQCTPGIIAVNTATFIGNKRKGVIGGIVATVGAITAPVIIILIIASVLSDYWTVPAVAHAFAGIRIAVAALIFSSVVKLFRSAVKDLPGILLAVAGFILIAVLKWSPVVAVLAAAVCGILLKREGAKK